MLRRSPLLGTLVVALTITTSSCSLFGGDPERPTLANPASTTSAPPVVTAPTGPVVLDPGAEPRTAQRLTLTTGTTADLRVSNLVTVVQSQEGRASRTFAPPLVVQTLRLQVGATDATGADLRITLVDLAVEVEDQDLAAELRNRWEPALGLTGRARLSDRGQLTGWELDLPEDLDPELRTQLDGLQGQVAALMPALPEEPIGLGAQWQSKSLVTVGGTTVEQESTYTLKAVLGSVLAYSSATSASAAEQPVALGLPEGTSARLTDAAFLGTSEGTLDLTTLAQEATASISGTQQLALIGAATETVSQELTVLTSISSS